MTLLFASRGGGTWVTNRRAFVRVGPAACEVAGSSTKAHSVPTPTSFVPSRVTLLPQECNAFTRRRLELVSCQVTVLAKMAKERIRRRGAVLRVHSMIRTDRICLAEQVLHGGRSAAF